MTMTTEPAQTKEKWLAEVTEREDQFNTLSEARQRVAIAKDVIAALDVGVIKNTKITGLNASVFFEVYVEEPQPIGIRADEDLRDVILAAPTCTACALGALFTAALLRADQCMADQVHAFDRKAFCASDTPDRIFSHGYEGSWVAIVEYLNKWFSYAELIAIEMAYELGDGANRNLREAEEYGKAIAFGLGFVDPRSRMCGIMQNIIDHEGIFTP